MYGKEYELALHAAEKAGNILKNGGSVTVDSASGKDIRISVEKESEAAILEILAETKIPVLSEECGMVSGDSDKYLWIIDPLDGTANYWKGMTELSCVSVALWKNNEPVLGVINRFMENEIYSGIVGEGAWLNGKAIHTSDTVEINQAVLATGFPVARDYGTESLSEFIMQVQNFKKIRMLGAAAIMGAFVAAGKIDAYMENEILLWDIAASTAIVKAAGGIVQVGQLVDHKCICRLFANEKLAAAYTM